MKMKKNDQMVVSRVGLDALKTVAKWARFLAILGFIMLGMMGPGFFFNYVWK